jgi:GT2 family glycosyltransferase
MGRVTIVLVTWNSAAYLPRCLEGVAQQTIRDLELIVVDNASTDDSVDLVRGHATRLIRNDTNLGFSAAVNQAIAIATSPFILLLNPDCSLHADYLQRLLAVFDDERVGSATGLLIRAEGVSIRPTGVVDSAGIRMTRNGRHLDLGQGEAIASIPTQPFEVFGVSGAAALFRSAFLQDVAIEGEVFDEDFFAYREDADLAWRGRLFGWTSMCEPRAQADHVRHVTPEARRSLSAEINMHSVKNRFLLRLKNEGWGLVLRNGPFEWLRDLIVFVAALTVELSSLPAFAWLWRNRARVLAKRKVIQDRRKVRDHELARWFR